MSFNEDILMVHGVPGGDLIYLLEEVTATGVQPSSEASVLALIESRSESLILCGHTHIPRKLRLSDGRLIVNPGSVGLQAYDDDVPCAHVMESGSPHARYAIMEQHNGLWKAELKAIEYDWELAALIQAHFFLKLLWLNVVTGSGGRLAIESTPGGEGIQGFA